MLAKSHIPPTGARAPRPGDATLSVTKAAHVLGVHPNTIRAWSEAGRLRYYRINDRGDRRYRLVDLQRFLTAAASDTPAAIADAAQPATSRGASADARTATLTDSAAGVDLLADLAEIASFPSGMDPALDEACHRIRVATGAALVGIWELRPGGLVSRATDVEGPGITAGRNVPPGRSLFSQALESRRADPRPARAATARRRCSGMGTDELVVRIPGGEHPWGVLVIAGADASSAATTATGSRGAIARTLGVLIQGASATEQASAPAPPRRGPAPRRHRPRLAARRRRRRPRPERPRPGAVRRRPGRGRAARRRGPRRRRPAAPASPTASSTRRARLEIDRLGQRELPSRRPVLLVGPGHAALGAARSAPPRSRRASTRCSSAPLVDGHELHGMLYLAHDRPHRWREVDLDSAEALAGDAAIAVRSARTFGRMADLGGPAPVDPAARVAAVRA